MSAELRRYIIFGLIGGLVSGVIAVVLGIRLPIVAIPIVSLSGFVASLVGRAKIAT
jgi:hypothetical protein